MTVSVGVLKTLGQCSKCLETLDPTHHGHVVWKHDWLKCKVRNIPGKYLTCAKLGRILGILFRAILSFRKMF
jgi:hypothetical protein